MWGVGNGPVLGDANAEVIVEFSDFEYFCGIFERAHSP